MADAVARQLRDGVAVGEQAPAVMVRDTLDTRAGPAIFDHFYSSLCSNIEAGRSQAKGLVAVSLRRTPESYTDASHYGKVGSKRGSWLHVVDCYTDPLGWNERSDDGDDSDGAGSAAQDPVCHDIRNLTGLLAIVLKAGQAAVKKQSMAQFSVVFDSVSVLLRYHTLPALTNFISALRSCEKVSAIMWLVHADLHETRVLAGIEYISTTVIYVEPQTQLVSEPKVVNLRRGRIRIRTKKRNGRVREQVEDYHIELGGVNFTPVTAMKEMNAANLMKGSTPKLQFNLELSEKEREDRSKVMLPFEHQGDGKEVHIYDGRPDPVDTEFSKLAVARGFNWEADFQNSESVASAVVGEIHYLRDSDDERPDSDEDPDDDLDI